MIAIGLASWVLAGAMASPEPAHVEVSAHGCGTLDAREVARLLQIELLEVTQEIRSGPPLQVELTCTPPALSIAVSDALTGKRLGREVPMPADEPGRERVVALAIGQLFAASWLELLLPPPPPAIAPQATERPEPGVVDAARELARTRTRERTRSIAVAFAPVLRGRALERDPLLTGGGELDVRVWFGNAAVVVRASADAGAARRPSGSVRALAMTFGVGAAGRVRVARRWDLGATVVAAGGFGRLRGVPSTPDVPSGTTSAPTGQLVLGAGPRLRLPPVVLELDAELGGMLRSPQGLVVGDRPVSLGGLLVGAALRVAIETPLRSRGRSRR